MSPGPNTGMIWLIYQRTSYLMLWRSSSISTLLKRYLVESTSSHMGLARVPLCIWERRLVMYKMTADGRLWASYQHYQLTRTWDILLTITEFNALPDVEVEEKDFHALQEKLLHIYKKEHSFNDELKALSDFNKACVQQLMWGAGIPHDRN
jgi:hypothetical protein